MRGLRLRRRIRTQESRLSWRTIASMRGRAAERTTRWLIIVNSVTANAFGAAIVFTLLVFVLTTREVAEGSSTITNLAVAAGYIAFMVPVGSVWVVKALRPARGWLIEDRVPTEAEQRAFLRIPMTIFWAHVGFWGIAAVLFGALNATYSAELAVRVAVTVAAGGLGTAAFAYLTAERLLRPVAARALQEATPVRPTVPGIKARTMIAWGLGVGLPTAGIVSIGISTLVEEDFTRQEIAISAIALGSLSIVLGGFAALLAARAVADPVASVRAGLAEVEAGNLDVEVPVYDGSEIGLLQSGFNRMAQGLQERERLHDLFGRHVGEDVARAALEGGAEMGGELRDVAVVFVDVIGSTQLAAERSPHEVVEALNSFFAIVVETVDRYGGWINKFEGDAALAIFGAPAALDDAPGRALAAGRVLAERLETELSDIAAGVGISFGPAVAGNIGEERRYEYTVIGDPVNEAARLSELAKDAEGHVLASDRATSSAGAEESARWEPGKEVTLRGRTAPTRVATPKAS